MLFVTIRFSGVVTVTMDKWRETKTLDCEELSCEEQNHVTNSRNGICSNWNHGIYAGLISNSSFSSDAKSRYQPRCKSDAHQM